MEKMKKFLSALFLFFFTTEIGFCNQEVSRKFVKESVLSNGVKVFLREDFRTPIAIVSFIIPIGLLDVPLGENATLILAAGGLIGKKTRSRIEASNASCDISVHRSYIKITATMDPDYVREFLELVCEDIGSGIAVAEDLDSAKKRMILKRKLEKIHGAGVVYESVFPNIKVRGKNTENVLMTEEIINSVTEDKCRNFYNNYLRTCPMTVVVIGAVGYKSLIKSLQATVSKLPKRKEIPFASYEFETQCEKTVSVSSKFARDSIGYVYKIPAGTNMNFLNIYFSIFFERLRKFLQFNSYPILAGYSVDDFQAGDLCRLLYLSPKGDVSFDELKLGYELLLRSMSKEKVTPEELNKIAEQTDLINKIDLVNLYSILDDICVAYMYGYDPNNMYSLAAEIKKVDPESISKFTNETLLPNLIMKVVSKYRADK